MVTMGYPKGIPPSPPWGGGGGCSAEVNSFFQKIGAKGWFFIHLQQVDPVTIPVSCVLSHVIHWLLQMTGGVLLALSLTKNCFVTRKSEQSRRCYLF
jgi:hypothetical protein